MDGVQSAAVTVLPADQLEALLQVRAGDSIADVRDRVERALGLDRPMPITALNRMMIDEEYFHDLIAARSAPAMLWHLIETAALDSSGVETAGGADNQATGAPEKPGALIAKAALAFAHWSKGGFTQVDEAVRERRLTVCLSCDQLSEPPRGLLYKIAGLMAADKRTCKACGCFVGAKARLPHENCPLPAARDPALSRWGEPLADPARH